MPNPDPSATPISQLLGRLCGGGVPASGGKVGGQLGQAVLQAFEGKAAQLVGAGLSLLTLAQHRGQGAGTADVNGRQPAGLQGRECSALRGGDAGPRGQRRREAGRCSCRGDGAALSGYCLVPVALNGLLHKRTRRGEAGWAQAAAARPRRQEARAQRAFGMFRSSRRLQLRAEMPGGARDFGYRHTATPAQAPLRACLPTSSYKETLIALPTRPICTRLPHSPDRNGAARRDASAGGRPRFCNSDHRWKQGSAGQGEQGSGGCRRRALAAAGGCPGTIGR